MELEKNYLVAVFNDDDKILKAVAKVRNKGIRIHDVFSPFPIHGIEEALGYKKSYMPKVAFGFGFLGLALALLMQYWMLGVDWPMIIGGKDFAPLPSFIPVTFEVTVLLSALGMVGVFMIVNDLKPYRKPKLFDLRITDDKFVMAVDLAQNSKMATEEIRSILKDSGADEINDKNF